MFRSFWNWLYQRIWFPLLKKWKQSWLAILFNYFYNDDYQQEYLITNYLFGKYKQPNSSYYSTYENNTTTTNVSSQPSSFLKPLQKLLIFYWKCVYFFKLRHNQLNHQIIQTYPT